MSKRDGKMYKAMVLWTKSETTTGMDVRFDKYGMAGMIPVFWTKTAARKACGRNVKLREISLAEPT